jgi:hypothetical protein
VRTIIAGSRGIGDYALVCRAINDAARLGITPITQVVSGAARGVDTLGERWARAAGVPVAQFPVTAEDWQRSRRAGMERNVRMAENADALVAIWDGYSPGTSHMIRVARERGLRVYVFDLRYAR